jgi:hypothetical protein
MLCERMISASPEELFGLIRDAQRIDLHSRRTVVFLVGCKACNAVHTQTVDLGEQSPSSFPRVVELWEWLVSQAPRIRSNVA